MRDASGFTYTYNAGSTVGTWYKVEARDIDWVNKSFDLYVNNALVYANAEFYNAAITGIAEVHLSSYYNGDFDVDNVVVGSSILKDAITFLPNTGTISGGNSNVVSVSVNASDLVAGTYYLDFLVQSNDLGLNNTKLPVELTVVGDAILTRAPGCIQMDTLIKGQTQVDSIYIYNSGCDTLKTTSLATTDADFSILNSGMTLPPEDTAYLKFSFNPNSIKNYNDSLIIKYNGFTHNVCIKGVGLGSPVITLDTTMMSPITVACGDSVTITRTLGNTGDGALEYQFGSASEQDLQSVLDTLMASSSLLNAPMSNIYNFVDGVTSNRIWDGGANMYDYGNYMNTDLSTSYLWYSDGFITTNTWSLGAGGQYFTHKGTGIWVFGADINNVNTFNILGGLGANGLGSVSSTVLTKSIAGKTYKGFVKRVYAASPPSVNHLIIVEENGNQSHTWSTNTNVDDHSVTGLTGNSRIYYILWAGTSGHFYNNGDVSGLMTRFLNMIHGNNNPSYVSISPENGSVGVSGSTSVSFTFKSEGLPTGIYTDTIFMQSNQPERGLVGIPVTFNVQGIAELTTDYTCYQFDSTFVGGTDADSVMLYNTGCDSLVVNSTSSTTGYYSTSPSSFVIPAEDSLKVELRYSPTTVGNHNDTLQLIGNTSEAKICVLGRGRLAPLADIDTSLITVNIASCNDSVTVPLTIRNNGQGKMIYDFEGSGNDTLQILAITLGFGTPHYANAQNALLQNINVPYKITEYNGTIAATLTTALQGKDVAWMVPAASAQYWQYTNLSTALQTFVSSGKGLIASGTGYYSNLLNTGIFTGFTGSWYGTGTLMDIDPLHANNPIVQGITSPFSNSYKAYYFTLSNPGVVDLAYYQSGSIKRPILSEFDYGSGRVIYSGFDHYFTNTTTDQLLANAFRTFYSPGLPDWLTASPDSAQVEANDSIVVNLTFNSSALVNGTYEDTILISTDDPLNRTFRVPVKFIVNGPIEFQPEVSCVNFDTTVVGVSVTDSVWIHNPGCDTLKVTGNSSVTNDFNATPAAFDIAPNDSALIEVTFSPSIIGNYVDTLTFASNLAGTELCVGGVGQGAPAFTYSPTSFSFSINTCNGLTAVDSLYLQNILGQGVLNYNITTNYNYTDTNYVVYTTNGALTTHNFVNTPTYADSIVVTVILNGDFDSGSENASLSIEGTSFGILPDNNTLSFDTIVTVITNQTQISAWLSDGQLDINLQNSSIVNIFSFPVLNSHEVIVEMSSGSPWLTVGNPLDGSVQQGGTVVLPVTADATGMPNGVHNTLIRVETNDPLNPSISIPVTMHIKSGPEATVDNNCLNFGSVASTGSYADSVVVRNTGCTDLTITSLSFNNTDFGTTSTPGTIIPAGDSAYVNVTFTPSATGQTNGSLTIGNSDTTVSVCLIANVESLPTANFDELYTNACDGVVSFTDISTNNPTQWYWDFGDGNISIAQNPTHTYLYPGIYTVKLKSTNLAGSDSLIKQVDVTSKLYVDFDVADSIFVNTPVQFIDSSQVALGWQWFFGDGNSSQLQNPTHTYTNTGVFNVSFIANSASCSKTINRQVTVYGNISVDEFNAGAVKVYPVPANGKVTVEWQEQSRVEHAEVYDGTGRLILDFETEGTAKDLDVSAWSNGVYMLKLYNHKGEQIVKQLIIQH